MQIFGSFVNFLARRPAALTVLFFYALDQIFGNVAFECPCSLPKELNEHFAKILLICPACMIVFVDIPWSLLFSIIKARCFCCQEACGGALMAVIPPMGFSLAWIFLFMESEQFSKCINPTNNVNQTGCVEDYNSTQYRIRITTVVLLYLMTSALGIRAVMRMCAPFCNRCCKSKCESKCKSKCESPCIVCCNDLCEICRCSSCCSFCCTSCCKSCCASCCNSCCDFLTIHPNSGLLKENLSFSTFLELQKEHLLIEDESLKGYSVEAIDKVDIGQGQKIRLKNYLNSLKIPGPVKFMKVGKKDEQFAKLLWTAPKGVKGKDSGYIIQYKLIDSKQESKQKKESRASLSGLESNERYSIQIWVIQTSDKNILFSSIEICTTKSKEDIKQFPKCQPDNSNGAGPSNEASPLLGASPSNEDSKFSKILVTHNSVSLTWNLKESGPRIIGYKLQFKIVENQNHVDVQQSKTELSAEFSCFEAVSSSQVPYQFTICACIGSENGESSSIQIDGEGIASTSADENSQSGGEPEIHKELLCDKCSQDRQPLLANSGGYGSVENSNLNLQSSEL